MTTGAVGTGAAGSSATAATDTPPSPTALPRTPAARDWVAPTVAWGAPVVAVCDYEADGRLVVLLVKGSNNAANSLTKEVGGLQFALDRAYAMGLRAAGSE